MKKLLVIFTVLVSGLAFAGDFTVDKVNESGTRAVVKTKGDKLLYVGDVLEMKDEFAEVCRGSVVEVQPKSVVLDISDCKNAKAVKPGVELTKGVAAVAKTADVKAAKSQGLNTPNEDWYLLFGLGTGNTSYSEDALNDDIEYLDAQSDTDKFSTAGSWGVYWPMLGNKAMHGVSSYTVNQWWESATEELEVSQRLLAYSYQNYYGTNIGDGWFTRFDAGLARIEIGYLGIVLNTSDDTRYGLGVLAGGGYSWPIGSDTRIQLGANVTHMRARGEGFSSFSWNLSWLF